MARPDGKATGRHLELTRVCREAYGVGGKKVREGLAHPQKITAAHREPNPAGRAAGPETFPAELFCYLE